MLERFATTPQNGTEDEDKNDTFLTRFKTQPDNDKPKYQGNFVTDQLLQAGAGALKIPGQLAGLADIPAGLMGLDRPFTKLSDAAANVTGFSPTKMAEAGEAKLSPETQTAKQTVAAVKQDPNTNGWDVAKSYVENPRAIAGLVSENLAGIPAGNFLGRFATGYADDALRALPIDQAVKKATAASAVGEGLLGAGQAMQNYNEDMDPTKAALAATATGAVDAAVPMVSGNIAQKAGIIDPDIAPMLGNRASEVVTAPLNKAAKIAAGAIEEGLIEEAPQSAGEEIVKNIAENKPIFENVDKAAVEGAIAGGVLGAGVNAAVPSQKPVNLANAATLFENDNPVAPNIDIASPSDFKSNDTLKPNNLKTAAEIAVVQTGGLNGQATESGEGSEQFKNGARTDTDNVDVNNVDSGQIPLGGNVGVIESDKSKISGIDSRGVEDIGQITTARSEISPTVTDPAERVSNIRKALDANIIDDDFLTLLNDGYSFDDATLLFDNAQKNSNQSERDDEIRKREQDTSTNIAIGGGDFGQQPADIATKDQSPLEETTRAPERPLEPAADTGSPRPELNAAGTGEPAADTGSPRPELNAAGTGEPAADTGNPRPELNAAGTGEPAADTGSPRPELNAAGTGEPAADTGNPRPELNAAGTGEPAAETSSDSPPLFKPTHKLENDNDRAVAAFGDPDDHEYVDENGNIYKETDYAKRLTDEEIQTFEKNLDTTEPTFGNGNPPQGGQSNVAFGSGNPRAVDQDSDPSNRREQSENKTKLGAQENTPTPVEEPVSPTVSGIQQGSTGKLENEDPGTQVVSAATLGKIIESKLPEQPSVKDIETVAGELGITPDITVAARAAAQSPTSPAAKTKYTISKQFRDDDDLLTAIARFGGLNSEQALTEGLDPADFKRKVKTFGSNRIFTKKGYTFDQAALELADAGYDVKDANDLLSKVTDSLNGTRQHFTPIGSEIKAQRDNAAKIEEDKIRFDQDLSFALQTARRIDARLGTTYGDLLDQDSKRSEFTSDDANSWMNDMTDIAMEHDIDLSEGIDSPSSVLPEPIAEKSAAPPGPVPASGADSNPTLEQPLDSTISEIDDLANEAATSPKNDLVEPTSAQKDAGNYKKGHVNFAGFDVTVENPAGSKRTGIDSTGSEWSVDMKNHYGYIKRSKGADGEQVDVFLGDRPDSDKVFVVNQNDPKTGKFDEHKVVLGAESVDEAKTVYQQNYAAGWQGAGDIVEMSKDEFKSKLDAGEFNKPIKQSDVNFSKAEKPQFYSQLKRSIESAPEQVFSSGEQAKLWLSGNSPKQQGVKSDEIYWSGIEDYLNANPKASKQDVIKYLDENGVKTEDVVLGDTVRTPEQTDLFLKARLKARKDIYNKYDNGEITIEERNTLLEKTDADFNSQNIIRRTKHNNEKLTLPGGTNYQETVVTIPTTEKFNESDATHFGDVGQGKQIAWMRHNDRTDANGNKVLFLEEIQSQRGQEGRKKGFGINTNINAPISNEDLINAKTYYNIADKDWNVGGVNWKNYQVLNMRRDIARKNGTLNLVPPAPFVTDSNNKATNAYISLLMKKAVMKAVENGQDHVSWTTGDQQADRYDLSKKIDSVRSHKLDNGRYHIYAQDLNGNGVINDDYSKEELSGVVGKDLANKLISESDKKYNPDALVKDTQTTLRGIDLRMGGKWTQSMYGNEQGLDAKGAPSLITKAAKDIAKKFGGQIGTIKLDTGNQPALIITPEMKAKILGEGVPLFSRSSSNTGHTAQEVRAKLDKHEKAMLRAQKLNIVESANQLKRTIPDGVEAFYDQSEKKIWVIANNVAKDKLPSVLNHEYLHAAIAENPKIKERLLGSTSELRVIFEQVENGTYSGKYKELYDSAMRRVDSADTDAQGRFEEWLAYQVSEHLKAPKTIPGRLKRALQSLLATIRSAIFEYTGKMANITPADLAALAKSAVKLQTDQATSTAQSLKNEIVKRYPHMRPLLDNGVLKIEDSGQFVQGLSSDRAGMRQGGYDASGDTIVIYSDVVSKEELNEVLSHELLHRAETKDEKLKKAMRRFEGDFKQRFNAAKNGAGSVIEIEAYQDVVSADTAVGEQMMEFRAYIVSRYLQNQTSGFIGKLKQAIDLFVGAVRAALIRNGLDAGFINSLGPADLIAMTKYGVEAKRSAAAGEKEDTVLSSIFSRDRTPVSLKDIDTMLNTGKMPTKQLISQDLADDIVTSWVDLTRPFDVWVRGLGNPIMEADLINAKDLAKRRIYIKEKEAIDRFLRPLSKQIQGHAKRLKFDYRTVHEIVGHWASSRYAIEKNADYIAQDRAAFLSALAELRANPTDPITKSKHTQALKALQQRVNAVNEQKFIDPTDKSVRQGGGLKAKLAGGYNNYTARMQMAKYEALIPRAELEVMAQHIYDMMKWKVDLDLSTGKVSQEQVDSWFKSDHYVPLTGDPSRDEDSEDPLFFKPGGLNQTPDKQAKGRKESISQNAIDAAVEQVQKSARYYGWNDFKIKLNDIYNQLVSDAVASGLTPKLAKEEVKQDYGISKAELTQFAGYSPTAIVYNKGTKHFAIDISSQDAVDALRAANREHIPSGFETIASATRLYARFVTQLALPGWPAFNMLRDVIERTENVRTRELRNYPNVDMNAVGNAALLIASNSKTWIKIVKSMAQESPLKNVSAFKINPADPDFKLIDEFLKSGGATTFGDSLRSNSADLAKQMSKLGGISENANEFINAYNNAFELIAPFSIYKALKDAGVSDVATAAATTKNLMNYEKTGSKTGFIRALYAFVNPTLQGSHQMLKTLSTPLGAARFSAYFIVGIGLQLALRALADDDDETGKNKLDTQGFYRQERNFLIPIDNDQFLNIPVGYGMPQLARSLSFHVTNMITGHEGAGEATLESIKSMVRTMAPIAPSETSIIDHPLVFLFQSLSPTLLKAPLNVAANVNAFGNNLTNAQFYNRYKPKADQGKESTPQGYKDVAWHLNNEFGIDVYPEQIRELAKGYLIGPLNELILKPLVENPAKDARGAPRVSQFIDRFISVHDSDAILDRIYYSTIDKAGEAMRKRESGKSVTSTEEKLIVALEKNIRESNRASGKSGAATRTHNKGLRKQAEVIRENAKRQFLKDVSKIDKEVVASE